MSDHESNPPEPPREEREADHSQGPENGRQERSGGGLLAALAAREALYRGAGAQGEQVTGEEGSAEDQVAEAPLEPTPAAPPGPPAAAEADPESIPEAIPGNLEDELALLRERLYDLDEERAQESERLRGTIQHLEEEQAEMAAAIAAENSRNAHLDQICKERDERITTLEAEIDRLRSDRKRGDPSSKTQQALNDALNRLAETEAKYKNLVVAREKEKRAHLEEVAALTRQVSHLRQQLNSRLAEMAEKEERRVEWPGKREVPGRPMGPGAPPPGAGGPGGARPGVDLDAPVAAAGAARRSPQRPQPPPLPPKKPIQLRPVDSPSGPQRASNAVPRLVLFDDGETAKHAAQVLNEHGHPITAEAPREDLAQEVTESENSCAIVNLANPATWKLIRALRAPEIQKRCPLLGYAMVSRGSTGFWFGRIEFVILPVQGRELAELVEEIIPGATQAIAISPNEEVLEKIHHSLTSTRIRVKLATDRRQTLEGLRGTYPQVAVVHPNPSPVDSFRIIASIRNNWMFRDIPVVFLIDETAAPREDEILSAGVRTILRMGDLAARDLSSKLAATFNAAPAGQRPVIRR